MIDVLDGVRDHYRATGLTERLKTALAAFGPEDQQLTPQQLAPLDQFHTRGLAATAELGKLAGITAGTSVLDVGSGVGGPARFLAATYGCQVTGVDLSEPSRFRCRGAATCGDEHRRPGAAVSRDPPRAEVRWHVRNLRRRAE